MDQLRQRLVETALEWQSRYGVAPAITSVLSEYDAAMLVGCSEEEYSAGASDRTAVRKGYDFIYSQKRYQIKANRPSGKPGSSVTLVGKAKNKGWDLLIWLLYDTKYNLLEAWQWEVNKYIKEFDHLDRLRPEHMRLGTQIK